MTELERLRKAAYAADERYSAELARVYGSSSCEARYRFTHQDPKVTAAADAKIAADKAYWAALSKTDWLHQ